MGIGKIPNDPGKIIWSSLTDAELANYENVMADLLDGLQVPSGILHGNNLCSCDSHLVAIEHYFQSLVDVVAIADSFLPRKKLSLLLTKKTIRIGFNQFNWSQMVK